MPSTAVQDKIEDNLEQLISPSLLRSVHTQTADEHQKLKALLDPRLRKKLERCARQLGNNRENANDLAQKTLLRAAQNLDSFNIEQDLLNWCTKILIRLHIDSIRAKKCRVELVSADSLSTHKHAVKIEDFADSRTFEDHENTALEFLAIQAEEFIKDVFADKPEYLEIVLLRAEGIIYEEIAEITLYPASPLALRKRSFNATKKLKQAIHEIDLQYEDLLNRFYIGR
jgi:DNA-directed RNA polymerase specialized sigma24 family protein